ncbi:MAG TPA: hypothetical protein VF073_06490 [Gaiella sp.]
MAKSLSCRLGRHTWTEHVEKGESCMICSACGKTAQGPMRDIEMPRHEYTGWRGGNTVDKIDNP